MWLVPSLRPSRADVHDPVAAAPPWRTTGVAVRWILLAVAGAFVGGLLVGQVSASQGAPVYDRSHTVTLMLVGSACFQCVMLLGALRCGQMATGGEIGTGLANNAIKHPLLVAALGFLQVCWVVLLSSLIYWAFSYRHGDALSPYNQILAQVGPGQKLVGIAIVVVGAPLSEELFFRGWLWTTLRRSWGMPETLALTGLLWLCVHLPEGLSRVALLLPSALLLGLARHYGRSVRASLALHALNNAIGTGFIFAAPYFTSAPHL